MFFAVCLGKHAAQLDDGARRQPGELLDECADRAGPGNAQDGVGGRDAAQVARCEGPDSL